MFLKKVREASKISKEHNQKEQDSALPLQALSVAYFSLQVVDAEQVNQDHQRPFQSLLEVEWDLALQIPTPGLAARTRGGSAQNIKIR